jgi:glycerophosphoryl diester phosphodiesterase
MKRSIQAMGILAALGAAGAVTGTARGAVLINEVLYNEVSSDTTGEWVEIINTGPELVDLSGYKFGDEETAGGDSESGGMWQFPEGATLAPGGVVTVAVSAARFTTVYGKAPTYEIAGTDDAVPDMRAYLTWVDPAENFNMSNSNDQAVLLGPDDSVADAAGWGNTFAFDPGLNATVLDGQSYRRIGLDDTDSAADWEVSPDTGVAVGRSSPGEITAVPEPTGLTVVGIAALTALRRRRRA